jgi:hypothetical protein
MVGRLLLLLTGQSVTRIHRMKRAVRKALATERRATKINDERTMEED